MFAVNWFRKGEDGQFLWPGFGDNARVLKWIFERTNNQATAVDTPIGRVPAPGSLDLSGLDLAPGALDELTRVDANKWKTEAASIREYYKIFGEHLPFELAGELDKLEDALKSGRDVN